MKASAHRGLPSGANGDLNSKVEDMLISFSVGNWIARHSLSIRSEGNRDSFLPDFDYHY